MKAIPSSDYIIRPFVTHKSQTYLYTKGSTSNPPEINILSAKKSVADHPWNWYDTSTVDQTGIYEQQLFESIKSLFSKFLYAQYGESEIPPSKQVITAASNRIAADKFFFKGFFPKAYFGSYFDFNTAQPVSLNTIYNEVDFFNESQFPDIYFPQLTGFILPSGSLYFDNNYFSNGFFPPQTVATSIPVVHSSKFVLPSGSLFFNDTYFSNAYFPTLVQPVSGTTNVQAVALPTASIDPNPEYLQSGYFDASYFPDQLLTRVSKDGYLYSQYFTNSYFSTLVPKSIFDIVNDLTGIYIISCAQKSYGEAIRRNSIRLHAPDSDVDLVDDGVGNIVLEGTNVIVGNVLYSLGLIIIVDSIGSGTSTIYNKISASITDGRQITLSYSATVTIYEHQIICTMDVGEFNFPTNPTLAYASSDGSIPVNSHASGDMPAYLTTVGVYNERGELMVIGKFPQAIRRAVNSQQTVILRFDV